MLHPGERKSREPPRRARSHVLRGPDMNISLCAQRVGFPPSSLLRNVRPSAPWVLPEPTVVAPDAKRSETCDFPDAVALVVSCGPKDITATSKVFIYSYDTALKAGKQYSRLWWCSKVQINLQCSSLGISDVRRETFLPWWNLEGRQIHRLILISYTWLKKMFQRELRERRRQGKIAQKPWTRRALSRRNGWSPLSSLPTTLSSRNFPRAEDSAGTLSSQSSSSHVCLQ
mmetsp:Transcript_4018/g.12484  ORF Transcript_4018/g.12484 Transcript_4018/m.12484 type:complete len:229 (+) Transcript_4018:1907-2593(+)